MCFIVFTKITILRYQQRAGTDGQANDKIPNQTSLTLLKLCYFTFEISFQIYYSFTFPTDI